MNSTKQISFYTIGNIATLFFQWLIIMLIPKITDFAEAGVFAVAVSVSSIMNQIATFTLNQYQVADRYSKFTENEYAITRIITITVSYICIFPISLIFDYGTEQICIIFAYTTYRNIINYAYLHMSSLQIANRLDYPGKCMVLEGIASFSVFVGSYEVTGSLLIATSLMAMVGGMLFYILMEYGHKKILGRGYRFKIQYSKNVIVLLVIGFSLMVSMICPIIITALPKLILENYWGHEIVGIFSTLTAPTIVIPTIASSIFAPFIVYFSDICRERDMRKLRLQYTKMVGLLFLLGIGCYVLSFFLSDPIFEVIYGHEIAPYTHYFNILIVGIFLYSIGICGVTVLMTKGQEKAAGSSAFCALLVSIVVFMIMIPDGGMDGATWGLMIAYGVFSLFVSICVYLLPLKQ